MRDDARHREIPWGAWRSRLVRSLSSLTDGQQRIAQHVLDNPLDLAFMTTQQLAAETGVSEASIVRFARAIGFDGYPSLQREVQTALGHAFSPTQRMEQVELVDGSLGQDGLSRFIRLDIEELVNTERLINRRDFDQAVRLLNEARAVYILGARGLAAPAQLAYHFLAQIRPNVYFVNGRFDRLSDDLARLSAESTLLAFDFGRYNRHTLAAVKFAHQRGSSITVIVDDPGAPTTPFADAVLLVSTRNMGFFQSHTVAVSLASALVAEVAACNRERALQSLGLLEESLKAFDVFIDITEPGEEP